MKRLSGLVVALGVLSVSGSGYAEDFAVGLSASTLGFGPELIYRIDDG